MGIGFPEGIRSNCTIRIDSARPLIAHIICGIQARRELFREPGSKPDHDFVSLGESIQAVEYVISGRSRGWLASLPAVRRSSFEAVPELVPHRVPTVDVVKRHERTAREVIARNTTSLVGIESASAKAQSPWVTWIVRYVAMLSVSSRGSRDSRLSRLSIPAARSDGIRGRWRQIVRSI